MLTFSEYRKLVNEGAITDRLEALKYAAKIHRKHQRIHVHGEDPRRLVRTAKNTGYYGAYAATGAAAALGLSQIDPSLGVSSLIGTTTSALAPHAIDFRKEYKIARRYLKSGRKAHLDRYLNSKGNLGWWDLHN